MTEFVAQADALVDWIRQLAQRQAVFFPQRAGERSFRFEPVSAATAIDLAAYAPTIVPPNKKLMPAVDELMRFAPQIDQVVTEPILDRRPRVLAGVRSCDLKAIELMDRVQGDGIADPHYWARRDQTAIIAIDCRQPCDERCFCQATGSLGHKRGADVYLTPVDGQIVVETLTPRGEELLKGAKLEPGKDTAALLRRATEARPKSFGRQLTLPVAQLPAKLKQEYKSAQWEKHVTKCFSCGTCTMVCPTCYCFDVKDDLGFDLASGNRVRTWDSCMLPQFALVAGGHNFRPEPAARQRHRVKRKFEYLMERFGGDSFCVGCGRCGRQCTTHIDIYDIVNDVAEGSMTHHTHTQPGAADVFVPFFGRILEIRDMTGREKYYKLELPHPLNHKPGQFVMVSMPGVGEAPISISCGPRSDNILELLIRKAGSLTTVFHALKAGQSLGIRGPFGSGFDITKFYGKDLLFICGGLGLAPLRSLITPVVEQRAKFGAITILSGALNPSLELYRDDLKAWAKQVKVIRLVDRTENMPWDGDMEGLVTAPIAKLKIDPAKTFAVLCGPPVMYKFAVIELDQHKIPHEQIYIDLERRMKCGVGKCGHCQINNKYCCYDGPVFRLADVKDLPEALA